jgi:hypothetical protein
MTEVSAAKRWKSIHRSHNPPGVTMSDDKSKAGGLDRDRIGLNDDYEARDWAKKFGVSAEELKAAVKAAGAHAAAVEAYLKSLRR